MRMRWTWFTRHLENQRRTRLVHVTNQGAKTASKAIHVRGEFSQDGFEVLVTPSSEGEEKWLDRV